MALCEFRRELWSKIPLEAGQERVRRGSDVGGFVSPKAPAMVRLAGGLLRGTKNGSLSAATSLWREWMGLSLGGSEPSRQRPTGRGVASPPAEWARRTSRRAGGGSFRLPRLKGAASRLAALGPVGPPLDWTAAAALLEAKVRAGGKRRGLNPPGPPGLQGAGTRPHTGRGGGPVPRG